MFSLKYFSNFWRTLEMPLINCEIYLILTWSANCVIVCTNVANQGATFAIAEVKLYVPVATLSTQNNAGFNRTVSWKKYLLKPELLPHNPNLNYLIQLSFQGVNRLLKMMNKEEAVKDIIFRMQK